MILYNARMAIIVAVVVALFFFLAGCVKMGIFISRCPETDIPALVDQLLLQAWPLGVAAFLFVLIDICLRRRSTSLVADEVSNIPEHPLSAPLKNSHPVTDNIQSASSQSYFHIDGQQLPQFSPEPKTHAKQQSYSQGPVPFSTPPPFEESALGSPHCSPARLLRETGCLPELLQALSFLFLPWSLSLPKMGVLFCQNSWLIIPMPLYNLGTWS